MAMARKGLIVAVTTSLMLVASVALAATPRKVIDSAKFPEEAGVREVGWLGWTRIATNKGTATAYLKPDGEKKFKVRPTPAPTFLGGITFEGPRADQAVFWQFRVKGSGTIQFVDLDNRNILKAPRGINTARSEELATLSGDHLLFGRGGPFKGLQDRIMLYTFSTRSLRTLATTKGAKLSAGQVNGDYATWSQCRASSCQVTRLNLETDGKVKPPPAPAGRANFASAVAENGTLFWVESDYDRCGVGSKIMRLRNGNVTQIAALPDGVEADGLYAWSNGVKVFVVFTQTVCGQDDSGIYQVVGERL
jgi:hypothetical protein